MFFLKKSALISACFAFVCSVTLPLAQSSAAKSPSGSASLSAMADTISPVELRNQDSPTPDRHRPLSVFSHTMTAKDISKVLSTTGSQSVLSEQMHESTVASDVHNTSDTPHQVTSHAESAQSDQPAGDDLYWLSRIIEAEAGGEPMATKIAVGDVIMNRVHSGEFPKNIHDVIFQRDYNVYEFSPVGNGHIYNQPSNDSVQAAESVLNGHINTVPHSLVFYNSAYTSAGNWVRSRHIIETIGHMTFAE